MDYRLFTDIDGVEHVIIDRQDGSQLSMPKSIYDQQQAALETPMVIDEASTK